MPDQIIDHLFRHQFGKMVSILTKIFGIAHLETIEDAVQDTFVQAMRVWSQEMPENPEAWLTAAAKNRVIDLFRSIKAEKLRSYKVVEQINTLDLDHFFLDQEIEDSQLRMIFTACHPSLAPQEQIAFALKTLSGFSQKEIAAALMVQEETIKKRLQRARSLIKQKELQFEIPIGKDLEKRLDRVLEVIYVIFNEGFHSNKKALIIRKDLCGESMRLIKMVLNKKALQQAKVYALFALMCFHSARLDSKVNDQNELINLADQDRSKWYYPLVILGSEAMNKAVESSEQYSSFHYEAAIAAEHVRAPNFESTNWKLIAEWYEGLYKLQPFANIKLNMAVVQIEMGALDKAYELLKQINPKELAHKAYLFHATLSKYYYQSGNKSKAIKQIDIALEMVPNPSEHRYFNKKRQMYLEQ